MRTRSWTPRGQPCAAIARCASTVHWRRADRARERDEERVALGIDLEPVPLRESGPQHSALLGQQVRVFLPQPFQQPGRALDVREQERDRARRDGRRRLPEARVIGDAHMSLQLGARPVHTPAPSPVRRLTGR